MNPFSYVRANSVTEALREHGGDPQSRYLGGGTNLVDLMRYGVERGCLVVAASGNRGASAPREPVYPAAYAADGLCLQIGAADAWDRDAAGYVVKRDAAPQAME